MLGASISRSPIESAILEKVEIYGRNKKKQDKQISGVGGEELWGLIGANVGGVLFRVFLVTFLN